MKNYQKALKALILSSLLVPCIVSAQSAASATSASCLVDPQVFTQNAVNQVLGVLSKDESQIRTHFSAVEDDIQTELTPLIGIATMSQFVVPPAIWSSASSSDQAEFETTFLRFIINLYSSSFKDFHNQTIKVYPARVAWASQKNVQINSVIQNPAAGRSADIPVSFVLQPSGCSWLFVDFVVDNISALANIQSQVQSILQNMHNPSLSALTAVIQAHNNKTAS